MLIVVLVSGMNGLGMVPVADEFEVMFPIGVIDVL
jgi:hypothetical protein